MTKIQLFAISPIDGRYHAEVDHLRLIFSEFALMKYRVFTEVEWLIAIWPIVKPEQTTLSAQQQKLLRLLHAEFDEHAANRVKAIEATCRHDVKAVEYYLQEQLLKMPELKGLANFVHYGLTSEDVNSVAYALMLKAGADIWAETSGQLSSVLAKMIDAHADLPMLSRTHGQPASPTTLGKEIANFQFRLTRQQQLLAKQPIFAKMNGAVGNYHALAICHPDVDWPAFIESFLSSMSLVHHPMCTQIEPHDYIHELLSTMARANLVLLDFCRDFWGYISLGYFKQVVYPGEVGSSVMPHKVNPIHFENAEANLGMANGLIDHMCQKLPISRFQRDLSDSSVLRNVGMIFAYHEIAVKNMLRGLEKIVPDVDVMRQDLDGKYVLLAEAIQTMMRLHQVDHAYEKLKAFTQGKAITDQDLADFIAQLPLPTMAKEKLLGLAVHDYVGLAKVLALKHTNGS